MSETGALAVTYRPLAGLVPYARNARTHSPTQIAKIKASLLEFGWANAMLVADNQMIAGHARLAAALELLAEGRAIPHAADPSIGPTIDLSHLSATQRRAYILTDNRLAEEAAWDLDLLRVEFQGLQLDGDFNVGIAGFDPAEIATVLTGWTPDLAHIARTEAALSELEAMIHIRCLQRDREAILALVTAAVAGYEHVTIT